MATAGRSRWLAAHTRANRRQALRFGALGGVGALLAACGGGAKTEDKPSGAVATGQQATIVPGANNVPAQVTGTPKAGGVYSRHWRTNPVLDPYQSSQFTTQTLAGFTTARLLKFKTGPTPAVYANFDTEPDLAESVEITPDGLTVTAKLRAGAKWQNLPPVNGRVVDSEDIKVSIERFRAEPKNSNRTAFGTSDSPLLESVQTPDPRTVVMKLAKPYGPFRSMLANFNYLWMLPKESANGGYDPAKTVIGAGPFILDKIEPDIAYTLRRNPDYYGAPMPYVDTVKLVRIDQETQDVAQFQAGQLDYIEARPDRIEELRRTAPKATFLEYQAGTFQFLAFQQRGQTPFKDERVRQAASHAIDRDGVLAAAFEGKGVWQSFIPASFGGWRVDPKSPDMGAGGKYYKYDPAESKKLLAAAGYSGLPLKYIFSNNIYGEQFNRTAEVVAEMLREGGFTPQIVTMDYQTQYIIPTGPFYGGNFEHAMFGLETGFSDPHDYFFNMYHTKGGRNHAGINDPQLEAMIDKEGSTLDQQERVKLVKDLQRFLATKLYYVHPAVGFLYLGHQPWIKNFNPCNQGYGFGAETAAKLWIDRS